MWWEGKNKIKPWDFRVTVAIPGCDHADVLKTIVELWQAQTVQPFIFLIDTGSTPEQAREIRQLRSENVEVHSLDPAITPPSP